MQALWGDIVLAENPKGAVDEVKGGCLLRRTGEGVLEILKRKRVTDPLRYLILEHGRQHIAFLAQPPGSVTAGQGRSNWNRSAVPPFTASGWLSGFIGNFLEVADDEPCASCKQ